ncbi:MAG: 50S ribosomal protein L19 [Cyanobacteria bacterium SZAS LIN-3]|nr:50S ribosomal protein L19 [Cyanobacteria bacterium SZAS LIN-3]MBS2008213.1 50S ribosomal protein L19 [Cyanobacteria bacterium SZAS TMP-1]
MNSIIKELESPLLKKDLPKFDVGDTVKVFVKIREGGKERTQGYEGVIIKHGGHGVSETITVRRVFQGIGIERVFLVHSPRVEKITVVRRGHVRRAKLYYLRERTGKATRIKEKVGVRRDAVAVAAAPAPAKAAAAPAPSEKTEAPAAEA